MFVLVWIGRERARWTGAGSGGVLSSVWARGGGGGDFGTRGRRRVWMSEDGPECAFSHLVLLFLAAKHLKLPLPFLLFAVQRHEDLMTRAFGPVLGVVIVVVC